MEETNVLVQGMGISSNDFTGIFGKREAAERMQEDADRFIETHKDGKNITFVGSSKNTTNTTKVKYTRQ